MRLRSLLALPVALMFLAIAASCVKSKPTLTIGSKAFPESWILGEALAQLARQSGTVPVEHRSNLGGTEIVYQALKSGRIDVYPEYTGTIAEVILKAEDHPSLAQMRTELAPQGIGISDSLGFNDGYALAVMPATQERYGLRKISDLASHPNLRLGFTHEFIGRQDGFKGLAAHYGLPMSDVRGIQHELAYSAIASGQIDVMEIYTTDAQIERLGLRLLEDDRGFFPRYDAVLLYRLEVPKQAPIAFEAMTRLIGKIDEPRMIRANARVVLQKESQQQAAASLLQDALGARSVVPSAGPSVAAEIAQNTARHLQLVAISLLAAILIGVPLGVLATRSRTLAAITLASAGLLQTIPSLALLAFLIPLLGIGVTTTLVALFLYSLLPIVRNTYTGLATIPPNLTEAAEAMGLSPAARLFRVSMPMASPAILAGIKTSAVINVGTATLAALIGGGGLGEPILRGISLVNRELILQGAIPAAVLALLVQWGFDLLDLVLIPRGLRLPAQRA
jgi:osmoprotectant transport system substrate-binding protein/osmoprotectant transport system permease protein